MRIRRPGSIRLVDAARCRKPLLAYHGSPGADRALGVAIELTATAHGRLTIISAAAQIPFLAYTGAAAESVIEFRRTCLRDAERALCRAVERVPRETSVTKIVTSQPIDHALLRQASEGDHDLIILGQSERGPIRSALFGNVGRTMLRRAPIPVLVVQPRSVPEPVGEPAAAFAPMTPHRV
jgi:nucleotide-binding universal stress UspA family protein